MDADDHGNRKCKIQTNESEEEKTTKKKKKGNFEVVRCENLFPGNIKAQFPSAVNTFDCFVEGEYPYDTKHTYPAGMKKKKRVKIVQGKRLGKDVISLLSNGGKREYLVRNNGVRVPLLDSIAGKYPLVCCFALPVASFKPDAELCRNMISAYSQLKAAACNFEMVIVARIASANMVVNDGDEEAVFNRFFDAFPCLAVPFSDSESRDLLCYSLGLTTGTVSPRSSSLLLDPDQLVLQTDAYCFNYFGAAAFPFTTHHLDALYRQDYEIKLRLDFIEREMKSSKEAITTPWIPVSLEELLGGCHLLRRTGCIKKKKKKNKKNKEEEVISVSELSKKKCVGLYLCYDGNYMHTVDEIHKECVAKNQEFEVVVYIPFDSNTTSFIDAVNLRLCEEKIASWWVMPLVDEACRRLWRLCGRHMTTDNLVILTNDGWGDLKGRFVIEEIGIYPFTRKSILDQYILRLMSFTAESLLLNRLTSHCGYYNVPASVLKGKNVLLCVDDVGGELYRLVQDWYNHIQEKYPDTQVVFVPFDETYDYPEEGNYPPWLLCLRLEAACSVRDTIFRDMNIIKERTLVAFGKDGFVLSRKAQYRIHKKRSLFADTLRQELVEMLASILMMS